MYKILLTGGMGFIGSHTCVSILDKYPDSDIVIIDNLSNSKQTIIDSIKILCPDSTVSFHNVDLCSYSSLQNIFALYNFDLVIHFAGLKAVAESIKMPLVYYNNNIIGTLNLLDIMKEYDCKNIIFSSSATVYGSIDMPSDGFTESQLTGKNITNSYGKTKYFIEEILKDLYKSDNNWNITILRYFNPFGAHPSGLLGENPNNTPNNLMPLILKNLDGHELKIFGGNYNTRDGTCIRDFIHVVDLAEGHVACMDKMNQLQIYNLGTGTGVSVMELINKFQEVNYVTLNYKITDGREGDIPQMWADVSLANKILSWKAARSLDDICRDAYKFYKCYKLHKY